MKGRKHLRPQGGGRGLSPVWRVATLPFSPFSGNWGRLGSQAGSGREGSRAAKLSNELPQLHGVFWGGDITSGYRPPTSSAVGCILSFFQMTDEAVNIWTHFLPIW
uniref:Uncharacterized protein n=1 Tax=Ornithorhynchus anatinus TaxID=9258 RepID=A0A6I8PCQ0_ORNAN